MSDQAASRNTRRGDYLSREGVLQELQQLRCCVRVLGRLLPREETAEGLGDCSRGRFHEGLLRARKGPTVLRSCGQKKPGSSRRQLSKGPALQFKAAGRRMGWSRTLPRWLCNMQWAESHAARPRSRGIRRACIQGMARERESPMAQLFFRTNVWAVGPGAARWRRDHSQEPGKRVTRRQGC